MKYYNTLIIFLYLGLVWWRSLEEKRQRIPQETRFFSVQKRDAETLLNLIRSHVAPGTQIWSDCWRAYMGIDQLPENYIHLTVNHSEFYTDDITGVNTNAIEAAWNRLRHNICRTKREVGKVLWKQSSSVFCSRWFSGFIIWFIKV